VSKVCDYCVMTMEILLRYESYRKSGKKELKWKSDKKTKV